MTDDRITFTGELKLPEGADVEAFKAEWERSMREGGRFHERIRAIPAQTGSLVFEPDGYYDTDGKLVITGVSLVRRNP